jgi:glutathione S-transferase
MKLVGPYISGFTRRTAIAMKLLGLPFEHLDLNAYVDKEEVRRYSPMGKVPALVLDSGEVLIDSAGIIDVLHEMVAPEKALIPPSGAQRFKALQLTGIGLAIYPKLTALYDESLRPDTTACNPLSRVSQSRRLSVSSCSRRGPGTAGT